MFGVFDGIFPGVFDPIEHFVSQFQHGVHALGRTQESEHSQAESYCVAFFTHFRGGNFLQSRRNGFCHAIIRSR